MSEKPWSCQYCEKSFGGILDRNHHLKTHPEHYNRLAMAIHDYAEERKRLFAEQLKNELSNPELYHKGIPLETIKVIIDELLEDKL